MTYIRRLILALALSACLAPAFAQVPPPVPALPDTERRTSYSISASTCACNVGFALYGDSTDVANWIEVFVNGVRMAQAGNWGLTSATGTIGSIPLPITNAVLTFTAPQTGTIQIVGARRPRRTSQFNEGAGIPTRNMNVVISDLTAQNRELWDKTNDVTGRALMSQPGVTLGLLPLPAACASGFLGFDATGLIPQCFAGGAGSGNVIGPVSSVSGDFATFNGTTGALLQDTPSTVIQNALANKVWAGPTSGGAAAPAFRSLVGADLPVPSVSTLGGVQSLTCAANQWLNTISVAGVPACAQPNFTNLSGTIAGAQIPASTVTSAMLNITTTSCTNQHLSAISATGTGTCTTDLLASAQHANQGTTTTVLHGNAAGNPAFGSVVLGAGGDVTGTLPVANGGTGDTGTAWTTFTPSPSCGTATFTTNSARSKTLGKTTFIQIDLTITAIGSCTASNIVFNLPNTAQSAGNLSGRETAGANIGVNCTIAAGATTGGCLKSTVAAWLVNDRPQASGVYENQ